MFISLDGQNYTEMKPETVDNVEFYIEPAACRYIRLITGEDVYKRQVLGETDGSNGHWSMKELILYETK